MNTESQHPAAAKRQALARAAQVWAKSNQDDEADLALDMVLHDTGTLSEDEAILEVFLQHNGVVVVLESGIEAICIDIGSGSITRGALE